MTGINKHIEFAIKLMQDDLWDGFNNDYNGRSFRIKKGGALRPEIYKGNNEYKEVFTSDRYDSIVHFDLDPTRNSISKTQITAGVNIIFAVNIGKIYGSSTRAVEEAHNDAIRIINNTAFQFTDIVTGIFALSDYDLTDNMEHKFDMQPYYVFKLECSCKYSLSTVCEPITPKQYSLTLGSDANGSVQPFEGTQLRNVNETIAINATPNVDSLFKRWLINGIESFINPTWVKMTNNITAIAEFFRTFTLNISSVGNGSTIPATGSYEYEEGETVQIEAIPDENNQFDNFDIDGLIITENPYQLVMDSLKNVVANFSLLTFSLDISNDGNGTTTPTTGVYDLDAGSFQEITATPTGIFLFQNFNINGTIINENPYSLEMNEAKTVVANFYDPTTNNQFPYTLPFNLS